ncbi:hypothetical protein SAMN05518683_102273 [Salibacterium halotolerans]|uniref:Uncharacterized protein n=1 Tax=Salibacterium halotolerans TaxID=1884432 RepID=A0A1I5MM06_9BACI|nr:hypothetical protein SAMN05518683_102273 [Salibacterium halotolerans]
MNCPVKNCRGRLYVLEGPRLMTSKRKSGLWRRRRQCDTCSTRMSTWEAVDLETVVKHIKKKPNGKKKNRGKPNFKKDDVM